MHTLFVTDGIVLQKRGVGEANVLAVILTEELGLVRALARSARAEKSKLRYGLEPLSRGTFSLIRGKYEWKLVGAEQMSSAYLAPVVARRHIAARATRLLLRLINGEEPMPALYQTVLRGLAALVQAQTQSQEDALECVLVLRILSHLGYLPNTPELSPFVVSDEFGRELAARALKARATLVRSINESLGATGL
ncbi:DNA repair protein RecO [Patescibacteria group bacterium]|nr:DNA repair protein RecO [Patescibacteria group bacterium]